MCSREPHLVCFNPKAEQPVGGENDANPTKLALLHDMSLGRHTSGGLSFYSRSTASPIE
jgi:hypothetical protein